MDGGGGRGEGGRPERTIELLWAGRAAPERAKPGLSRERIVTAAIELADAEGLAALSMRRLAERLGFTSMSLYRHVPGKEELVDLMREALLAEVVAGGPGGASHPGRAPEAPAAPVPPDVAAEAATAVPAPAPAAGGWRASLEAWARAHWGLHRRHPWLVETHGPRRLPGPNGVADYEAALHAVAGTGLRPSELVAVVGLVGGFVDGAARQAAETAQAERRSGVSDTAWWAARQSLFDRLGPAFPTLDRVWSEGGYDDPEDPFEFGLRRVLDGIETLVRSRGDGRAAHTGARDETDDGTAARSRGCALCDGPVARSRTGRPRAYCSRACQQRAYRRRRGR